MAELTEPMKTYVKRFRGNVLDTDPLKNILNGQEQEFSDEEIAHWITESWYMINETEPRTSYSLSKFPKTVLLLDGAMMKMLEAKGLLHLRNQLSYSDAGFNVNLDDKSGHYAQWLNSKATLFYQELKMFKRSRLPKFRGIGSPMRYY
ncbi:hypothetical protein AAXE64_27595 [Priestia megaterium]